MERKPLKMLPRLLAATWCMVGVASWVESAASRAGWRLEWRVAGLQAEEPVGMVRPELLVAVAGGMSPEVVPQTNWLERSPRCEDVESFVSTLVEVSMVVLAGSEESLLPAATGNITLHCFFRGAACNQSFRIKSGNKQV